MKILHTSDWHIGKKLNRRKDRSEEHRKFFDWLIETIQENQIDLLLVSGDIFDHRLPSIESASIYYDFLSKLHRETEATAIIIAGNHDSAARLSNPRDFLRMGKIHVVGELDRNENIIDQCRITVNHNGSSVAVVALPYLSESDVLSHISLEKSFEKSERYREAIRELYHRSVEDLPADLPKILMGHLWLRDGEVSGSEQVPYIGGESAILTSDLPDNVDYVALGHLHRPQSIEGKNYPIRYSGSPIPMSFDEATYSQKIYIIELDKSPAHRIRAVEIDRFKNLEKVVGTLGELETHSMGRNWSNCYIDVEVKVEKATVGLNDRVIEMFHRSGGEVVAVKPKYPETSENYSKISIEEILEESPEEVFEKFHNSTHGTKVDEEMMETFRKLIALTEKEKG